MSLRRLSEVAYAMEVAKVSASDTVYDPAAAAAS
jgi:hypothetical protein